MRRDRQVNLLPPNRESLASGSSRVTLFFVTSEGGYGENWGQTIEINDIKQFSSTRLMVATPVTSHNSSPFMPPNNQVANPRPYKGHSVSLLQFLSNNAHKVRKWLKISIRNDLGKQQLNSLFDYRVRQYICLLQHRPYDVFLAVTEYFRHHWEIQYLVPLVPCGVGGGRSLVLC